MIRDPASTDLASPGRLEQLPARWATLRGSAVAVADARGEWTWRELEHGRWVRLPARMHRWRLLVSDDGWRVAISSSGDPAPQLPKGSHR